MGKLYSAGTTAQVLMSRSLDRRKSHGKAINISEVIGIQIIQSILRNVSKGKQLKKMEQKEKEKKS